MSIHSTNTKAGPFIADGSQREFPYRFKVLDPSHIQVYINGAAVDGGYTVNESSVMMDVAPPNGTTVVLLRKVPLTQEVDIQNNTAFYPEILEGAYDKLTMIAQQLAEQVERSIKVGVDETDASPDALLQSIYASGNAAVKAGEAAVKAGEAAKDAADAAKDASDAAKDAADTAKDAADAAKDASDAASVACLPDYSAGVSFTFQLYGDNKRGVYYAVARGLLLYSVSTDNAAFTININNQDVIWLGGGGRQMAYLWVDEGDVISVVATSADNSLIMMQNRGGAVYPLKGANK